MGREMGGWIKNLFRHRHKWQIYHRVTLRGNKVIFTLRKCACGANQLRNDGPMGDDSWRNAKEPFKFKWEQQRFEESVEEPR